MHLKAGIVVWQTTTGRPATNAAYGRPTFALVYPHGNRRGRPLAAEIAGPPHRLTSAGFRLFADNTKGYSVEKGHTVKTFGTLVADRHTVRRALHYLNAFRLLVAVAAVFVAFSSLFENIEGYRVFLAQSAALTYAGGAIIFLVQHLRGRIRVSELASFSLVSDLILVGLILHGFGGFETALTILLLFTVGIAGLILDWRTTYLFAAIVTVGLIADYLISFSSAAVTGSLLQPSLYGIAAFATATGPLLLVRWGRDYQRLPQRCGHRAAAANLAVWNRRFRHRHGDASAGPRGARIPAAG